ncbi:hypothetical protein PR048_009104 [Dryococelus australis]|uniref:Uncharacterized protein n=1 Tax=Dryococelus australis TaxID=614101 RepID=A0ABQ9HYZ0_9NEOP|nr:hypothetical protein PR048_009104 [Dryococelus australis]
MICNNMLPFKITESTSFNDLIGYLESRYKMPDRTAFSKSVIPDFSVNTVCCTTDMWSTHTCDDYNNEDFEHESVCLEVAPFIGIQNSANIAEMLKHYLLHKWNI